MASMDLIAPMVVVDFFRDQIDCYKCSICSSLALEIFKLLGLFRRNFEYINSLTDFQEYLGYRTS